MKIDSMPGYVPAKLHQAPRYPKPATSFKEAFDGEAAASSHHAISFDATGLWGAGKAQVIDETTAPTLLPVASISSASAVCDDQPGAAFAVSAASAASVMLAGGSAGNLLRPDRRTAATVRRFNLDGVIAGATVTRPVVAGVAPGLCVPWVAEASGLAAPARPPSALSAKSGNRSPQADSPETSETAFPEVTTDGEMGRQQPDGAAEAVSVIVSEGDGEVQIVAAVPDISDETRRQVREAAQNIAREAGIRINGFSLNGTALIHKPEPDRRTSWRSHL